MSKGRKPIDDKRRDRRVQVRLSQDDFDLMEIARGDLSRNEFIARSIRLGCKEYQAIRKPQAG